MAGPRRAGRHARGNHQSPECRAHQSAQRSRVRIAHARHGPRALWNHARAIRTVHQEREREVGESHQGHRRADRLGTRNDGYRYAQPILRGMIYAP